MPIAKPHGRRGLLLGSGLMLCLWLLAGCASLCTKHLYLFRETPTKTAPAETVLLITDPDLAMAAVPGANLNLQGAQWAPEQPSQPTDVYRLNIETVDGAQVYQGMCLDTLPNYVVELRPGNRQVAVRGDILGPGGIEKFTDTVALNLQPGKVYFLHPDWQEMVNRRLAIKMEILSEPYTPAMRARLIDRLRVSSKSASLD
jgi:hypothetical protein